MGWGGVGVIYRDEGKENGNYYSSVVGYIKTTFIGLSSSGFGIPVPALQVDSVSQSLTQQLGLDTGATQVSQH